MVVDCPGGLHPGVHDRGTHELEAATFRSFEMTAESAVCEGTVLPLPVCTRPSVNDQHNAPKSSPRSRISQKRRAPAGRLGG
jgi:hypothetical protein